MSNEPKLLMDLVGDLVTDNEAIRERHREIGRLVESLFASSDAPDTHLSLMKEAAGLFEVARSRYNFGDPVERIEDEGEGLTYTVLDPVMGEDRGEAATLLGALRDLAANLSGSGR